MRHVLKKSINTTVSEKVRQLISAKRLLAGVKRLGLAVSGGSDSVALLYIMADICRECGIVPFVLHFDHAIRGEASRQDALFVRDIAKNLGVEFITETASGISQGDGKSLEMAARDARQAFFRRAIGKYAIDAVATGHQADDVAETLVMRLLRGAGTDGLSGLKPVSVIAGANPDEPPIRFIRPLLRLRRDELRAWLSKNSRTWREDATNDDTSITRNNVRHAILPFLCKESGRNDDPVNALCRSAEILREDDDCLDTVAREWLEANQIAGAARELNIAALKNENHIAIQRRVLRIWLIGNVSPEAAGFDTVSQLLSADSGVITMPRQVRAEISGGILRILPTDTQADALQPVALIPGSTITFGAFSISADISDKIVREKESFGADENSCTISAAATAGKPLEVRTRRPGDRMAPYGINGMKKVKDIFIDAKLPEYLRDTQPLVTCGEDIVWIPGYRIAAAYAATEGEATIAMTCRRC